LIRSRLCSRFYKTFYIRPCMLMNMNYYNLNSCYYYLRMNYTSCYKSFEAER
jgi:hypothetical protein